jgi:type IV secretory pathway TraG/TraD family ATPase VirD4
MASEQETSRPLLTPDEVMRLPDDSALVFVAGHPAIYPRKILYNADTEFLDRSSVAPPNESDRLEHDWSHWTSRAFPRVTPAIPPDEAQTTLLAEEVADAEETEAIRPQEAF